MGTAAGCSGHRLTVARCCVTRDYVRAEAAVVQEGPFLIYVVTLQYATSLINHSW